MTLGVHTGRRRAAPIFSHPPGTTSRTPLGPMRPMISSVAGGIYRKHMDPIFGSLTPPPLTHPPHTQQQLLTCFQLLGGRGRVQTYTPTLLCSPLTVKKDCILLVSLASLPSCDQQQNWRPYQQCGLRSPPHGLPAAAGIKLRRGGGRDGHEKTGRRPVRQPISSLGSPGGFRGCVPVQGA